MTVENTRIRRAMSASPARERLDALVEHTVRQVMEYHRHGFEILGIVGADRSPNCGVETTSDHNMEVPGKGLFMEALSRRLAKEGLTIPMVGLKRPEDAPKVTLLFNSAG